MSYFAAPYTIHFDDTMAYGSHHFLTAFKLQCAARESLLFGRWIFGAPGVEADLSRIHLLTGEAYARNIRPARLGERLVVLATVEERGRVSLRFCFRVLNAHGEPVVCGFQTILCAAAATGELTPFPDAMMHAFEQLVELDEVLAERSFRERVLAGGGAVEALFDADTRALARAYLAAAPEQTPQILPRRPSEVASVVASRACEPEPSAAAVEDVSEPEAWVFSGQGTFDAALLSARVAADPGARMELDEAARIACASLQGDAAALLGGDGEACRRAALECPDLEQVGIFVQNVLGARQRLRTHGAPAALVGHSFGEIAALSVSGAFDLVTGVRVVCARVAAVASLGSEQGGILAVALDRESARGWIERMGLDEVFVAGRNHASQTVISGPAPALSVLEEALRAASVGAVRVPSPAAFHHPMLLPAAAEWRRSLRGLSLQRPALCVYSPIGRRLIADDDLAVTLSAQLVRPFDLQGALADLVRVGIRAFVDCGTTGSLERLVRRAAGEGARVERVAPHHRTEEAAPPRVAAAIETCPRAPVAIVGGGCLLPGGARDAVSLFDNLLHEVGGIVDLRERDPHWADELFSDEPAPDRSTSALAGMVHDDDLVAPEGVPESLFARYDRAQKILAISLAQCRAQLPAQARLRCLVGCTADGFDAHDTAAAVAAAGVDPTVPEIAHRLGLDAEGSAEAYPAIARVVADVLGDHAEVVLVDAACASSLYCVALGMRALEVGEVDVVLAGGIFSPGPGNSCLFSQFRGLSATGVRPFDASADGVVFGEGGAFVVLRRLDEAEREGVVIRAVLRGAGLASDGLSASANVPRSRGQVLAMKRCHEVYGLDAADVEMVEAHGTGTPVGDSTELRSLQAFFAGKDRCPLVVRSLKALLGHTGWAAGTASILATCEAIRRNVIAPQSKHGAPSEALREAGGLLSISPRSEAWPTTRRRAAVNGFGFGGADAQVVLEAYRPGALRGPDVTPEASELVVVATSSLFPTEDGAVEHRFTTGAAFDRRRVGLPAGVHVLPDLAEDMDVTQSLLLHAVSSTLDALPDRGAGIREEVALVVAMDGKTERGVDATLRVLGSRLARVLHGTPAAARVTEAAAAIRASGPYTLQGMMPNVAAGRAASRLDLAGPNFVVNAGRSSLDASLGAASLLLGDSARVVIVSAVCASRHAPRSSKPIGEAVVSFAVTTPALAASLGLPVLARLARGEPRGLLRTAGEGPFDRRAAEGATELLEALEDARRGAISSVTFAHGGTWTISPPNAPARAIESDLASDDEPIVTFYEPVWVEAPLDDRGIRRCRTALVVAPAHLAGELLEHAAILADEVKLVVPAGTWATDARALRVDVRDEAAAEAALGALDGFMPELILMVERPRSWDLAGALTEAHAARDVLALSMLVARRWVSALEEGAIDLVSLCLHGVDESGLLHPASGGLAGMLKSFGRELSRARVRPLVTSATSVGEGLAFVARERAQATEACEEVGDICGARCVRRLRKLTRGSTEPEGSVLGPRSVVVATGGARGVTAVLVEALLRRYGCTVVALGRSVPEAPPADFGTEAAERRFYAEALAADPTLRPSTLRARFARRRAAWEAWRERERFAALPGRFVYHSVDITDRADTARALGEIAERHGEVDLVLHGAGVQFSARLERRKLDEIQQTIDVKLSGLYHLQEVLRARRGRDVPVHALTSAYSFFGNDGQPDYGAANEILDRLCAFASARTDRPWKSIGWLAWDGIGMTRGSEYGALAKERGLSAIGPAQGQRLFLDVIEGRTQASIHVQLTDAERTRYGIRVVDRHLAVDPRDLPCLPHHLVRGRPTLPGAFALERFVRAVELGDADARAGAAAGTARADTVVLEKIRFSRFVRLGDARDTPVRVSLSRDARGEWWGAKLVGDLVHPSGHVLERDLSFCEALLSLRSSEDAEPPSLTRGRPRHPARDPYCQRVDGRAAHVALSGPFDCLREIEVGADGRQAIFVPPRDHADCLGEALPALLLDAAWRLAVMHAEGPGAAVYVPVRVGRVTALRRREPDTEPLFIRASAPEIDGEEVTSACAEVIDRVGRLRLRVEGSVARRVA
ncbi:modular polyketide synthase [Minicystis rosea]|nr:modular polyketide synthase [Minicystis rosea]